MLIDDNDSIDWFEELKKLKADSEPADSIYDDVSNDHGIDLKKIEEELLSQMRKLNVNYSSENSEVELGYNYPTDSGFDFYSSEDVELSSFGRALISTGVRIELPENIELQVRSKSGLAINKGLMVLNSPGTVDEGYTGEIKIILFNTNNHSVKIDKGMKIAQGVFSRCINGKEVNLIKVEKINEKERGENGFGSTGI